ncbi:MAG: aminotransferase class I/II-fold pyridoxal phosphate-dependent enzyme [gamma proteobacterium symbiont of Lucinoma myriamae]|nr:aminotransferase class I/II-fold pyridoxal phosphate-dependent enzyme [gamma proteobacterium symbiont of Lucinoma myriamae]MCU7819739.1 aminotransferase class I/II-fold pyridoxal phosphate-dependent enzyme [gamma proteobacterium symbiont of Lucinoma myriamae]MCU7832142.1 aminotransferase class I/II-fold pyridoxal phosphate-dependent enzyme [gamma proteobacterium symbiont of Lucinoma myriamae]
MPGEQPLSSEIVVKLNTNENPYPPAPDVFETIKKFNVNSIRFYPHPESELLKQTLSRFHDVPEEFIFVGNGSDEVLAHAFCAFFSGKKVVFPDVTYSFYQSFAKLFQCQWDYFELRDDFTFPNIEEIEHNTGIVFANPNAPTSIAVDLDYIEKLANQNSDNIVLVDEAYIDFGGKSAVHLTKSLKNLVVIRTLSKSHSLAGLRVGYSIASAELTGALSMVKNSFNSYPVNSISQAAAIASINNFDYTRSNISKILLNRKKLIEDLEAIGFSTLASQTNFVFTKHEKLASTYLYEELKKRGIIVRNLNGVRTTHFLRITVGNAQDCNRLIIELINIINK